MAGSKMDFNFSGNRVFIIAEAGKNFIQTREEKTSEEYLANAKELIRLAYEAGADAVKFQTHNLDDEQFETNITSPHFLGSDRYNWIKRNDRAATIDFWKELKAFADELGIIFFSTPMSRGAAVKLEEINVPLWKVGSGDILDFVMLDYLAQTKKPIILSSGMSTLEEVDRAVEFLKKRESKIALLHCVSRYPCPPDELNLKTIEFFKNRYKAPIGFSDHSIGFETVLAAVELGAVIIEKHFSLSRDLWGADHKVSMTPDEFEQMVKAARKTQASKLTNLGSTDKLLQDEEVVFRPIFRKILRASRDLKEGEILEKNDIYAMRPQEDAQDGLPSEDYEKVLGKKLKKDIKKYDPISRDVIF